MNGSHHADDEERRLRAEVVRRLGAGAEPSKVIDELASLGVDREVASRHVWAAMGAPRPERIEPTLLARAVVAAGVAAAIGAVAWGLISVWTEYEVGIVATGIGFLAGRAVVAGSGGRKGLPLQVIAVVAGIAGIFFGKYFAFVEVGQEFVGAEFGEAAASTIRFFSADTFSLFLDVIGDVFGGFDLLWVGLAVLAAWRIPKPVAAGSPSATPAAPAPGA